MIKKSLFFYAQPVDYILNYVKILQNFYKQKEIGNMKALAILALVFSALSVFIPVGGVFTAMGCSVLALISFRSYPTLSGIAFGINIISTAFLSPSLLISAANMHANGQNGTSMYWFYVGFHIVLLLLASTIFFVKRNKTAKLA